MLKSEMDRKTLVSTILPSVKHISQKKFLSFYQYFVFRIFKRNDLIFNQGDIADSIYLIQYGKCRLIKNNRHILTMGQNDFVGLEAIDNNPFIEVNELNNKNDLVKYGYSLYCHENCSILQIKLSALGDQYYQIKFNMNQLRKTKEDIISKYNEINEHCSFHHYKYLSYLNKQNRNGFSTPLSAFEELRNKKNKSQNTVLIKKIEIKPNIIQQGTLKSNYNHNLMLSEQIIQANSSLKSNIPKFFNSLNKNQSRNIENKNVLLDKLYGNTNDYNTPVFNKHKIASYKFDTGTCSLPLLTLYG